MMKNWKEKKLFTKQIGRKTAALVLAGALIGAVTAGGVSAYFTDRETAVNTFVTGKISLDLKEPDWNPDNGTNLTPGQTVRKNPLVENDGVNPEFVFVKVSVPYDHLVTADADGTRNEAADMEFYNYHINSGWHEISETKRQETKTVEHVYVYGTEQTCTELQPGTSTPSVFDEVTLVNLVEDAALEGKTLEIGVSAYGIQTSNLDGEKTAPAEVWEILSNQASDSGN